MVKVLNSFHSLFFRSVLNLFSRLDSLTLLIVEICKPYFNKASFSFLALDFNKSCLSVLGSINSVRWYSSICRTSCNMLDSSYKNESRIAFVTSNFQLSRGNWHVGDY